MKFPIIILTVLYAVQGKSLFEKVQDDGKEIIEGSQALLKTHDENGFMGYCSGVIVHPRFILVPYHCSVDTINVQFRAGYTHVDDDSTPWIQNDCYKLNSILAMHDFAYYGMFIFIQAITGGNIAIAKLQTTGHDVVEGQTVYVPTFNTYNANEETKSFDLTVKKYQVINQEKCRHIYQSLVNKLHFCYGDVDGSESCEVDLGGVLYKEDGTFLGLTEFRDPAQCNAQRPAISLHFGNHYMIEFLKIVMSENDSYNYNCTEGDHQLIHTMPFGVQMSVQK